MQTASQACSPGVGCGRGWGRPQLCLQLPQPLPLPWLQPRHLSSTRQGLGEGSWDLGDRQAPRAQAERRGVTSGFRPELSHLRPVTAVLLQVLEEVLAQRAQGQGRGEQREQAEEVRQGPRAEGAGGRALQTGPAG